jgi:hypothetical protein
MITDPEHLSDDQLIDRVTNIINSCKMAISANERAVLNETTVSLLEELVIRFDFVSGELLALHMQNDERENGDYYA